MARVNSTVKCVHTYNFIHELPRLFPLLAIHAVELRRHGTK